MKAEKCGERELQYHGMIRLVVSDDWHYIIKSSDSTNATASLMPSHYGDCRTGACMMIMTNVHAHSFIMLVMTCPPTHCWYRNWSTWRSTMVTFLLLSNVCEQWLLSKHVGQLVHARPKWLRLNPRQNSFRTRNNKSTFRRQKFQKFLQNIQSVMLLLAPNGTT